jgi:hypothetical protein
MNMLEKIQFQLEHLSKSERKVAEVILASPAQAIHSSIAALAQEAGVSEPTVNRFCRSLETRGFPDFKLHLAQSLANGTPMLIAMWMKTTALMPIPRKFLSRPWPRLTTSAVSGYEFGESRGGFTDPGQENCLLRSRVVGRRRARCHEQIFPL